MPEKIYLKITYFKGEKVETCITHKRPLKEFAEDVSFYLRENRKGVHDMGQSIKVEDTDGLFTYYLIVCNKTEIYNYL